MANRIGALLSAKFESRPARLVARVTSVPTDATGKPLPYVLCEVAGQAGIRAHTTPGMTLYPGDQVQIDGRGGAATTRYTVAGFQAGTRPDSGALEIVEETTIGGETYGAGDMLWGNPFGAHFQLDYDAGRILGKTGGQVGLIIDAAGAITLGNPSGVHQLQTATGIEWRNGETIVAALDGASRTIYGFERLGRPHGPCIEWGEVTDDAGQARFALRMLGANGVPGFSVVTGSQAAPDDYHLYLGDLIQIAGNGASTIAGWVIDENELRSANGIVRLIGESSDRGVEGVTLLQAAPGAAGMLRWVDANGEVTAYDTAVNVFSASGTNRMIYVYPRDDSGAGSNLTLRAHKLMLNTAGAQSYCSVVVDKDDVRLGGDSNYIGVTNAGHLTMEGTATIETTGVTWVTGADAVGTTSVGQAARPSPSGWTEGPYQDATEMIFRLPLQGKINGRTVVINKISFYGYTSAAGYYFDSIKLRRSDLDGTYTDDIAYTTDIGNGSSGDTGEVVIYNDALTLADYPYQFVIKCAGGGSYANYRVYGLRIEWTTTL